MTNDFFRRFFSENSFFCKIRQLSGKVLESAFLLYLVMSDKKTPLSVKLAIISVLGYLICPLDAVPDSLPFVGYTDDLAVMTALLTSLGSYVTDEMRKKSREKLS